MAEKTGIEWSGATWNPWVGCTKVSPGCKNCYMFRDLNQKNVYDPNTVRRTTTTFNSPLKWHRAMKRIEAGGMPPKNYVPRGSRIFTCSYSDFFHQDADEWRAEAWEIIRNTRGYTYIILTKRPENIKDRLPDDWGAGYPNVWLLVSAENQMFLKKRWAILDSIPAVVRGISAEPLLEKLELDGIDPVPR